jgi:hypothetical protein
VHPLVIVVTWLSNGILPEPLAARESRVAEAM